MSTLTGTKIKDTYPSLLKLINNGSLQTSMPTIISDGLGNVTPLQISETVLQTQYSASNIGLNFNFNTNLFQIGDYDILTAGSVMQINGVTAFIGSKKYGNQGFSFSSFGGSYYNLVIGDAGSGNWQFQEWTGITNIWRAITGDNQLELNGAANTINTTYSSQIKGLSINFTNKTYNLGDFNSVDNGTSVVVNDTAETVTITAEQDLVFVGAGMENTGAGSTSGKYLRILLNGGEYKIELLDP
jgi:hypothetical protein